MALTGGHRLDRVGPTGSDTRQHRVVADRIGRAFEYRTTYAARRTWGDSWPYASQQQHTTGVGGVIGNCAGHFDGALGACHEHDDAFIRALRSDGIVPTGDPAGVVAWAHWACGQLNQGANKQYVVAWLSQSDPNAANGTFLRKAALYYCPQHNNKLAGW